MKETTAPTAKKSGIESTQYPTMGITFFCNDGEAHFIPHAWLVRASLNKSESKIEVYYTSILIEIVGNSLGSVLKAISTYRVEAIKNSGDTIKSIIFHRLDEETPSPSQNADVVYDLGEEK